MVFSIPIAPPNAPCPLSCNQWGRVLGNTAKHDKHEDEILWNLYSVYRYAIVCPEAPAWRSSTSTKRKMLTLPGNRRSKRCKIACRSGWGFPVAICSSWTGTQLVKLWSARRSLSNQPSAARGSKLHLSQMASRSRVTRVTGTSIDSWYGRYGWREWHCQVWAPG
jgi:hypothetical protein